MKSLPTWSMWRIAAFGSDELGANWRPGFSRLREHCIDARDVHHRSELRIGEYRQTFFHLIGNAAEWVTVDPILRNCLAGSAGVFVVPETVADQARQFCGLGVHLAGRNEGWLRWRVDESHTSIGFRCALRLGDPIQLPSTVPGDSDLRATYTNSDAD